MKEIRSPGGNARFWHLDVTSEPQVQSVVADVARIFGRWDILINNAGISGASKPTHEITEEEWDRVMAVNVKGAFFCTKHAIPPMKASGGGSIGRPWSRSS